MSHRRIAWWTKPKRKLTKREKRERARARKRSYDRRKRQRLAYYRREARRYGMSLHHYVRARGAQERRSRTQALKILNEQGPYALMEHYQRTGQLY